MKQKLFLTFLLLLTNLMASAYDCNVDGIYYNLYTSGKTAQVTRLYTDNNYRGSVDIPSSVTYNGIKYKVTSIGQYAFNNCSRLTSVTIPNSVTSIGEEAFYDCSRLTSVTIGNSVTSIGKQAFSGCSGLTSITIPNSVTSIGKQAFSGCSGLTSITIPNSVTSIGDYTFECCSGLTSVTIGNSVTSIGKQAFYGCSGLTAVHITNIDAWCRIEFYDNDTSNPLSKAHHLYLNGEEVKDLIIPSRVRSIGHYAFSGCSGLTSVIIPYSVTDIGFYAFSGCSGLTAVTIGNNVTSINPGAFFGCSGLTSVTIPNSVKSIDSNAFKECSGLTSVTIGNSVTSIGDGAFSGCSGLTSVTIPNSVTSIGEKAFYDCRGLTSVTIPNSVTSIGDGAFYDCRGLTSVTIPNSVTSIGRNAFSGCSGLTSVKSEIINVFDLEFQDISSTCKLFVPGNTRSQYLSHGWDRYFRGGVYCIITSLSFRQPKQVLAMGTSPTLQLNPTISPSTVRNSSLEWSSSNENIATVSTSGLVTGKKEGTVMITCKGMNPDREEMSASCEVYVFSGNKLNISSVSFRSPTEAFEYRTDNMTLQLDPIISPSTIKKEYLTWSSSDEDVATVSSSGLVTGKEYGTATITCSAVNTQDELVTASCKVIVYKEGLIYVGNIFYKIGGNNASVTNCAGGVPSNMEKERSEYSGTVNVPASVTYDGVNYPVTSIGTCAFYKQSNLQAVVIPTSVTEFKLGSFAFAQNLARVTFMNREAGLISVGEAAFQECTRLNNVVLPNSTLRIDKEGFRGCSSLSNITLSNQLNYINEYAFADCPVLNNVTLPESLKSIQIAAFNNDAAMSSITFPAELEGIGASAFANCPSLKDVTFNTSHYNMTIGVDAFKGSNAISKVKVAHLDSWVSINFSNPEANPASIAKRIYNGSGTEIINAEVPEGPIYVNNNAFYNCQRLQSVTLPSSIQLINDNIFYGCSSLKKVVSKATIPPAFIGVKDPAEMNSVFEAADLYVPSTSVSSYASDDWWKRFKQLFKYNEPATYKAGDANGDGNVNVFDVTAIVNYILGSPSGNFVFQAADVNNDGNVNVFDVTKVVNIILGVNANAKLRHVQSVQNGAMQIVKNGKGTDIIVDDAEQYVAMQFDVVVSAGQTVEGAVLNSAAGHQISYRQTEADRYRVIAYSMENEEFMPTEDVLVSLKQAQNVTIENALFVTKSGHGISMDVNNEATGIEAIANEESDAIYSLSGLFMGTDVKALSKGTYIRNRKIFIIQ